VNREQVKGWCYFVIASAIVLEIVEVAAHPSGEIWRGLQLAVIVLFVIGVIALLETARRERIRRR
jgi:hypothetical protein